MSIAALLRRVDRSPGPLRQIDQAVAELHAQATAIEALLNREAPAGPGVPRQVAPDGPTLHQETPHRDAGVYATLIDAVEAALADM